MVFLDLTSRRMATGEDPKSTLPIPEVTRKKRLDFRIHKVSSWSNDYVPE